jgi:hypothetical protein
MDRMKTWGRWLVLVGAPLAMLVVTAAPRINKP